MNSADSKLKKPFRIIDISQPIQSDTACFPGDTPFSKQITVDCESGCAFNLTALTMSPHVGTHVDAPVHVRGSLQSTNESVGTMPLAPFVGPVTVIDIAPFYGAIHPEHVEQVLSSGCSERILIRTRQQLRYDVFEEDYAFFSTQLVDWFADHKICLAGLDTPSVDQTSAKELQAHHRLLSHSIYWLENLDLSQAPAGQYFLVAMPLKFMELEASPVRAALLDWTT